MRSTQDIAELAARLDSVERQLRRHRLVVAVLTALLGAVAVFAAAPQGMNSQRLAIRDAAGNDRVVITPNEMNFYSASGARKLFLGEATDGTPLVSLRDGAGTVRMDLFVAKSNVPKVALYDSAGRDRAVIQVSDEPFVGVKDTSGKYRASMYLTSDGTPTFDLNRNDGELLASLYQDRAKPFADLALYGSGGAKRFVAVGSDTPYLSLFNGSGGTSWTAP